MEREIEELSYNDEITEIFPETDDFEGEGTLQGRDAQESSESIYLREIGRVSLLTAEDMVKFAQRIEKGVKAGGIKRDLDRLSVHAPATKKILNNVIGEVNLLERS